MGLRAVQALAVDDEPEPFWSGSDAVERIEASRVAVKWTRGWGGVGPPSRNLNGGSGAWVDTRVLTPLGASRSDAWVTDCLDTYRASTGMAVAIDTVYTPFARTMGLALADVRPHPTEAQIVAESTRLHLDRLRQELEICRPEVVVTLGNAALRVMRRLALEPLRLTELAADDDYGEQMAVRLHDRLCSWLPLAHPASPMPYQLAHER
jgi:hypothetical protein